MSLGETIAYKSDHTLGDRDLVFVVTLHLSVHQVLPLKAISRSKTIHKQLESNPAVDLGCLLRTGISDSEVFTYLSLSPGFTCFFLSAISLVVCTGSTSRLWCITLHRYTISNGKVRFQQCKEIAETHAIGPLYNRFRSGGGLRNGHSLTFSIQDIHYTIFSSPIPQAFLGHHCFLFLSDAHVCCLWRHATSEDIPGQCPVL